MLNLMILKHFTLVEIIGYKIMTEFIIRAVIKTFCALNIRTET